MTDLLAKLIAPVAPSTFFSEYWEQKPLFPNHRGQPEWDLDISAASLFSVLESAPLLQSQVEVIQDGKTLDESVTADDGLHIAYEKLKSALSRGASLRLNAAEEVLTPLQPACRALSKRFSAPVQANIYYTPAHEQGFHPHYDSHDVVVAQVEGKKTWFLYQQEIAVPLRGQVFDPAHLTAPPQLQSTHELCAGDCAYVPRGWLHAAEALDEPSLHITFGIHAYCWTDILIEALAMAAVEHEELRRALPVDFADPAKSSVDFIQKFEEKLSSLGPFINTEQVVELFKSRVHPNHG